ncbi:MAG: hypothetical protein E7413_01275 [Ruminococcaceae bacterium]|nr:hypothetical protein [Oscillospiraceae bacterium]
MKKVFSLLLVVAMLASLSLVSFAADPHKDGGMHTVITDNGATATVEVYVTNVNACAGFNSILLTTAATYVEGSAVLGEKFATCVLNDTQNKPGQIKMIGSFSDLGNYVTEKGTLLAVSYTVNKVDAATKLTEADFAYGDKALTASKIPTSAGYTVAGQTAGAKFTSVNNPAYFTLEVDGGSAFSATAAGTTITCAGKVDATVTNYGVEFTKESTVEGARAQKYYGAMDGDTVSDGNDGVTTFTFGNWDGTFEIVLENVHTGTKVLNFFANDTIIADTTFTVVVE